MDDKLSGSGILRSGFVAAISAGLSYLIICFALHVALWGPDADDRPEHYLAIAAALAVFVVVFFRTRRGTWSRRHIDELTDELAGLDD